MSSCTLGDACSDVSCALPTQLAVGQELSCSGGCPFSAADALFIKRAKQTSKLTPSEQRYLIYAKTSVGYPERVF